MRASSQFLRSFYFRDPAGIQTRNPHIRSVILYSVELRNQQFCFATAKVVQILHTTK